MADKVGMAAWRGSPSTPSHRAISTPTWSPRRRRIVESIPVGRLGRAEEIARATVFPVADEAGFVTGSTLSIDGVRRMY